MVSRFLTLWHFVSGCFWAAVFCNNLLAAYFDLQIGDVFATWSFALSFFLLTVPMILLPLVVSAAMFFIRNRLRVRHENIRKALLIFHGLCVLVSPMALLLGYSSYRFMQHYIASGFAFGMPMGVNSMAFAVQCVFFSSVALILAFFLRLKGTDEICSV